jgi:hypothetical protein
MSKIVDCIQGSDAWLTARLGIPTASEFSRIITPARGDLSKSAREYAHELVAETLLGRPLLDTGANTFAMERGRALEPHAAAQYELTHSVETLAVGFITTNDGRIGCSPDRLIIGTRRGIEIKCKLDSAHMGMWIDGPGDKHKPQAQGILAVAELASLDLYAWHPELPPMTLTIERDEPYIAKMSAALREFLGMRDAMLERALASGWIMSKPNMPATWAAAKGLAA